MRRDATVLSTFSHDVAMPGWAAAARIGNAMAEVSVAEPGRADALAERLDYHEVTYSVARGPGRARVFTAPEASLAGAIESLG